MTSPLTRRAVFAQAWPIMLGQITVPLVGLVDTAVIGRTGDAIALAAVALGSVVVSFLFWSFGFLRMGMTGLTAQAQGAGEEVEVRALLMRGMAAGFGLGLALLALQIVLIPAAFALFAGSGRLDATGEAFVAARLWGAPAALAGFAINGWLLGLGKTRPALLLQVVMNVANISLDLLFVWHFHWGAVGVGSAPPAPSGSRSRPDWRSRAVSWGATAARRSAPRSRAPSIPPRSSGCSGSMPTS